MPECKATVPTSSKSIAETNARFFFRVKSQKCNIEVCHAPPIERRNLRIASAIPVKGQREEKTSQNVLAEGGCEMRADFGPVFAPNPFCFCSVLVG